jgi:hypothetical protein
MTCERDIRSYLAFDGDLGGVQRAWTTSLAAVHWKQQQEQVSGPDQQYSYEFADSPPVRLQWSTRPTTPSSTWNGCFGGHNCPGG